MAKYQVTRKDGKVETVELFGKTADRERKIAWLENTYSEEYMAKKNGYEIINMSYAEYKNNYSECGTISNSYDKIKKTIDVLVKIEEPEVEEEVKEEVVSVEEIAKKHNLDVKTINTMVSMPKEQLIANLNKLKMIYGESNERIIDTVECMKELHIL